MVQQRGLRSVQRDDRDDAGQPSEGSRIGVGTRVRGHVRGGGALAVAGEVEGNVLLEGELDIEAGGGVRGEVEASSVTVRGSVHGGIRAHGPVTILAGATVSGDVLGSEVSLEEGAAFRGRIEADFELPSELLHTPAPKAVAPAAVARGRR
jgi:cytoskeletal protein CcmA (bactofilin family)